MPQAIQKVNIITRHDKPHDQEACQAVCQKLQERRIPHQVITYPSHKSWQPTSDMLAQLKEGLLLSIGGDGSLLSLVPMAVEHQLPLLGLNLGRVGYLTSLSLQAPQQHGSSPQTSPPQTLEGLDSILDGDYSTQHCCLLEASPQASFTDVSPPALNEISLMRPSHCNTIPFSLYIDHTPVAHHRADGLIVATATGSTAYNLSSGGPILTPESSALVVNPVCTHKLTSRPLVISQSSLIQVKLDPSEHQAIAYADGRPIALDQPLHELWIRRSRHTLQLIQPRNHNFFHHLQYKLHWEGPHAH